MKNLKIFIYLFVIFWTLSLLKGSIYADDFGSTNGDVDECRVITTIGIQYESIGSESINWNDNDVKGVGGTWIRDHTIHDVANVYYPNANRYHNVATAISVPPHSTVAIGQWTYNYSGHLISIHNIILYTSHVNSDIGDLTRLGTSGSYGNTIFTNFPSRYSKQINFPVSYTYQNNVEYKGQIFYRFKTIQPIIYNSYTATPIWNNDELSIEYKLKLENVSRYFACNIKVIDTLPSGMIYDSNNCIPDNTTKELTYTEVLGKEYPSIINHNGPVIYDNNRRVEVNANKLQSIGMMTDSSTIPGAIVRDDLGFPNLRANQPMWSTINNPPLSIELIPYSFKTNPISIDLSPILTSSLAISDSDEVDKKEVSSKNREEVIVKFKISNEGGKLDNKTYTIQYDTEIFDDSGKYEIHINRLSHGEDRVFEIPLQIKDLKQGIYKTEINILDEDKVIDFVIVSIETKTDIKISLTLDTNNYEKNILSVFDKTEKYSLHILVENIGDATDTNIVVNLEMSELCSIVFATNTECKDVVLKLDKFLYFDQYLYTYEVEIPYLSNRENGSIKHNFVYNSDNNSLVSNEVVVNIKYQTVINNTQGSVLGISDYQFANTSVNIKDWLLKQSLVFLVTVILSYLIYLVFSRVNR